MDLPNELSELPFPGSTLPWWEQYALKRVMAELNFQAQLANLVGAGTTAARIYKRRDSLTRTALAGRVQWTQADEKSKKESNDNEA